MRSLSVDKRNCLKASRTRTDSETAHEPEMILNFCQLQFTTKFGAREALAHLRGTVYGRCANCFDSIDLVVGMLRFLGDS
jgi:hypothetical protein